MNNQYQVDRSKLDFKIKFNRIPLRHETQEEHAN